MLCYVMVCYVMLCSVLLCYAMSCYVMSCNVMIFYVLLCCAMLWYVMLCYAMLWYVMLCYVLLCYVVLCYVMLCCVMLCCVVLCRVCLSCNGATSCGDAASRCSDGPWTPVDPTKVVWPFQLATEVELEAFCDYTSWRRLQTIDRNTWAFEFSRTNEWIVRKQIQLRLRLVESCWDADKDYMRHRTDLYDTTGHPWTPRSHSSFYSIASWMVDSD